MPVRRKDDGGGSDYELTKILAYEEALINSRPKIRRDLEQAAYLIQTQKNLSKSPKMALYWQQLDEAHEKAVDAWEAGNTETAKFFTNSCMPQVILLENFGMPTTAPNLAKALVVVLPIFVLLNHFNLPILGILMGSIAILIASLKTTRELRPPQQIPTIDPGPMGWRDRE